MTATYLSIALAVLKLILGYVSWARERKLIDQGYDEAIANVTHSILLKTAAGKKILEKVNAMSDAEVDAGLRGLEPR